MPSLYKRWICNKILRNCNALRMVLRLRRCLTCGRTFLGHYFSLLCIPCKPSVKPDVMLPGVEAKTHECGLALPEETQIVQETEKKRLASVFRVVRTGQESSTGTKSRRGATWVGLPRKVSTCTGPSAWWMTRRVLQEGAEGRWDPQRVPYG